MHYKLQRQLRLHKFRQHIEYKLQPRQVSKNPRHMHYMLYRFRHTQPYIHK